jgi:predicted component of type VI protein secretion system
VKSLHLEITNGVQTTRLLFSRFPILIGREPPCDCILDFPFMSKRHAQLALQGGALLLRDEGSRNGTFVRGHTEQLSTSSFFELSAVGGEFQIGPLQFRATLVVYDERTLDLGAATQPMRAGDDVSVDHESVTTPGGAGDEQEPPSTQMTVDIATPRSSRACSTA